MKIKLIGLCFGILIFFELKLNAQCTPARADSCHLANVLCSLSEINGYCCSNPNYSNPTACFPLCPNDTLSQNTGWWAFATQGGVVKIDVQVMQCKVNGNGLQFGILSDCSCKEKIECIGDCANPGLYSFTANLIACKTYYLFVDGCNGDVCDFCLATSGGLPPQLPPLSNIVGLRNLCSDACNVRYSINTGGSCEPTYEWTLDGELLGGSNGEILLDFSEQGDFQLCVTAYIGNPLSGSLCDQTGPVCTTIQVRPIPDRGPYPLGICLENLPFRWPGSRFENGLYYKTIYDSLTCCSYDSILSVHVLDKPDSPEIFFIGCPGESYTDQSTRQSFSNCQYNREIKLLNSTSPWKCDSSYRLNAVFLNYNVVFREYCLGGAIVIEARTIDRTITCGNSGLAQDIQYKWYLKNDPGRRILGVEDKYEPPRVDNYCVELSIYANFGDQTKVCTFDFCEQWDEDQFTPYEICPKGDLNIDQTLLGKYYIDTLLPQGIFIHNWRVIGGTILTANGGIDTTGIEVRWEKDSMERKLCYNYISNCGDSKECCQEVNLITSIIDVHKNSNRLVIIPNPLQSGTRFKIMTSETISEMFIYDLNGKLVWSGNANKEKSLDLFLDSNLAHGVYVLMANCKKNKIFSKFIVQP